MKKSLKYLTIVGILLLSACMNPSMENGFEKLNKSLSELESAIAVLDIPQMIDDLDSMNVMVNEMVTDIEEYSTKMEEFNLQIVELQAKFDAMLVQVQGITEVVDGMIVTAGGLATTEQIQNLISQMNEFQQGVDLLVLAADYDYDGVINASDKCPNTPIGEINDVDTNGCSPSQI